MGFMEPSVYVFEQFKSFLLAKGENELNQCFLGDLYCREICLSARGYKRGAYWLELKIGPWKNV